MRELDRHATDTSQASHGPAAPGESVAVPARLGAPRTVAVVGRGRVGTALARGLRAAGTGIHGPLSRAETRTLGSRNGASPLDAVLLCVPDSEIRSAARAVSGSAPLVGHTSGATPLSVLEPAGAAGAELFGLHPLQTFAGGDDPVRLLGAGCAIAGSSEAAIGAARLLAERLGLVPFEIADEHRAAYHAAASTASNFLVTLQDAAEAIAAGAGMEPCEARRALAPLVRATVEHWAELGPERALTGPVARGDEETVAVQLAAVERGDPALMPLFEALVERTRLLAARQHDAVAADALGASEEAPSGGGRAVVSGSTPGAVE